MSRHGSAPVSCRATVVFVAALGSVAGCGSSEPLPHASPGSEADVLVVESPVLGLWGEDEAWRIEEVVSVGGVDTDPSYQFGTITGLDVDPDGNIYVVDRQAQNVRVFDPAGAYLRTIGGPGEGPGEFGGNAAAVFVLDGRVVVPDPSNARVSSFSLDGTFESDFRLDVSQGVPLRFDVIGSRGLVAQRRAIADGAGAVSGDVITRLVDEGLVADTLVDLDPGQSVQITGGIPRIHVFAPDPVWDSAYDGRLATGMTDAWRFNLYDSVGVLQRIVTRPVDPRAVTARDRRDVEQALREMYRIQGVPPELVENVVEAMEFGERFPAFASLTHGPYGSLWIQTLLSEEELAERGGATLFVDEMGSRVWDVVDSDGRYLGQVAFPTRFEPVRFLEDRFYGIERDDLDVESVRVYRVVTD